SARRRNDGGRVLHRLQLMCDTHDMSVGAADFTMRDAIRTIPSRWFKPDPRVYWADMLLSTTAGWTAFVLAIEAATLGRRAVLLILAAFALYRAVLFIHELTHLAAHELPAFRAVWNAVVGVPLLLPSFLYEGVHTDHHRQRS